MTNDSQTHDDDSDGSMSGIGIPLVFSFLDSFWDDFFEKNFPTIQANPLLRGIARPWIVDQVTGVAYHPDDERQKHPTVGAWTTDLTKGTILDQGAGRTIFRREAMADIKACGERWGIIDHLDDNNVQHEGSDDDV